jgi:hypothetical protein
MSEHKPVPSTYFSHIDWPRCPRCHEPRMRHSKTVGGPSGFEYRTFDCQKCSRTHTMIISSDPMDFKRAWLAPGEPKARARPATMNRSTGDAS